MADNSDDLNLNAQVVEDTPDQVRARAQENSALPTLSQVQGTQNTDQEPAPAAGERLDFSSTVLAELLQGISGITTRLDSQEAKTNERLNTLTEAYAALRKSKGKTAQVTTEVRNPRQQTQVGEGSTVELDQDNLIDLDAEVDNPEDMNKLVKELRSSIKEMSSKVHRATSSAPELDVMIEETQKTPFTTQISSVRVKYDGKVKLPPYDGKTDPRQFLTAFGIATQRAHFAPEQAEAGKCQLFTEHLSGPALSWFSELPENSINNFRDLSTAFLKHYSMYISRDTTSADLYTMKQGAKEPLREFIDKFKDVVSRITVPDEAAITALRNALWYKSKLKEDLHLNRPATLEDALHRAASYIEMEEERAAYIKTHNLSKSSNKDKASNKEKEEESQEPRQHYDKEYKAEKNKRDASYFVGNKSGSAKTANSKDQHLPSSPPVTPQPEDDRDPNLYCTFHGRTGHDTKTCRHLMSIMFGQYERGEIDVSRFKNPGQRNGNTYRKPAGQQRNTGTDSRGGSSGTHPEPESPKRDRAPGPNDQITPSPKRRINMIMGGITARQGSAKISKRSRAPDADDQITPSPSKRINMIMGGLTACRDSVRSIREYAKNTAVALGWSEPEPARAPEITFSNEDLVGLDLPHNDPLVVELSIRDNDVARVLIDTGSSVNVIFQDVLKRMDICPRKVKPSIRPLTGFDGNSMMTSGTIKLPISVGKYTTMHKFVVVDKPAIYNAILGTPWLHLMKAVPSSYHQCVKIPLEGNVFTLKGNQQIARNCFLIECKLRKAENL